MIKQRVDRKDQRRKCENGSCIDCSDSRVLAISMYDWLFKIGCAGNSGSKVLELAVEVSCFRDACGVQEQLHLEKNETK